MIARDGKMIHRKIAARFIVGIPTVGMVIGNDRQAVIGQGQTIGRKECAQNAVAALGV